MLFNSYEFLFVFLPLVLALYYALPTTGSGRTWLLTVASYFFYCWWNPNYFFLLFGISVFDYWVGYRLARTEDPKAKKRFLIFSLVMNLGLLAVFKYAGFLFETVNDAAALVSPGTRLLPALSITLPIGISFHTFQSMSYTIDVYRGNCRQARSLLEYLCFVALFPQLVAGPVVRFVQVARELESRSHTWEKFALGVHFFIVGLAKKVIIADAAAPLAAALDGQPDGAISAWASALAYTVQIYFDFSGYSDMAIGLGAMFGFDFPPNFDSPYQARSITDFWRRWHISLSTWLRDYLYIPLGGSRLGPQRTYVNLLLTMLLGGLWHGAAWTFIVWGAYHGALLAIERALGDRHPIARLPTPLQVIVTLALVTFGWVFFRATSMSLALAHVKAMLGLSGLGSLAPLEITSPLVAAAAVPGGLLLAMLARNTWRSDIALSTPRAAIDTLLLVGSVIVLLGNQSSPFLYFQF